MNSLEKIKTRETKWVNEYFYMKDLDNKYKKFSTSVFLISIYSPDISKSTEERLYFYNEHHVTLYRLPTTRKIFIMWDLNSIIGNNPRSGVIDHLNEENINDNGAILITSHALNELKIYKYFLQTLTPASMYI